jgi:hypothetical protein
MATVAQAPPKPSRPAPARVGVPVGTSDSVQSTNSNTDRADFQHKMQVTNNANSTNSGVDRSGLSYKSDQNADDKARKEEERLLRAMKGRGARTSVFGIAARKAAAPNDVPKINSTAPASAKEPACSAAKTSVVSPRTTVSPATAPQISPREPTPTVASAAPAPAPRDDVAIPAAGVVSPRGAGGAPALSPRDEPATATCDRDTDTNVQSTRCFTSNVDETSLPAFRTSSANTAHNDAIERKEEERFARMFREKAAAAEPQPRAPVQVVQAPVLNPKTTRTPAEEELLLQHVLDHIRMAEQVPPSVTSGVVHVHQDKPKAGGKEAELMGFGAQ